MKLFLASTAKHPESIKRLQEFAGDLSSKHIVYVPTAANGEFWAAGRPANQSLLQDLYPKAWKY